MNCVKKDMKFSEATNKYENDRKMLIERNRRMHTSDSYLEDLKKVTENAKKLLHE